MDICEFGANLVPGQLGLCRQTLSQKTKKNLKMLLKYYSLVQIEI